MEFYAVKLHGGYVTGGRGGGRWLVQDLPYRGGAPKAEPEARRLAERCGGVVVKLTVTEEEVA